MRNDFQLRKELGKVRRKLFKTNAAYWYCKQLKIDENIECPLGEANIIFDTSNHYEVVQWIVSHRSEFPWIYNAKEMKSAAEHSHYYPCLKIKGEIIGFIKVAVERVYIEDYEREIDLNKDEAFIYDTFVLPEYKRKHLASYLLAELFKDLIRKGIAIVYCHIPRWNVASSRLYLKMGFKRLSYIRYMRFLKFYYFSHKLEDIKKYARKDIRKVSIAL